MQIPAPTWVTFDSDKTQGLDLLGLRAPVQAIGNELMNGLTTVTPKPRYLSILSWIIWRYIEAGLPDNAAEFKKFAAAQEAALVMANVMRDKAAGESTLRLVGVGNATSRVDSDERSLPLDPLVINIAFNIYVSSSLQLNLTLNNGGAVYGLRKERGLELARAFDATIEHTAYRKRVNKQRGIDRIPRKDIEELSKCFSLDNLSPRETKILLNAILPTEPVDAAERRRLATFTLLLWLAAESAAMPTEEDVFAAAREVPQGLPTVLRDVLNGWLGYLVRDALAVSHEAVFGTLMNEVDIAIGRLNGPTPASEVIAALLNTVDDHNDHLRALKLLSPSETVSDMSFHTIAERVRIQCQGRNSFSDGLRRWKGGLSEYDISEVALSAGKASAALLPVAWCLAEWRVRPPSDASAPRKSLLSIGHIYQIGLDKVVFPKLDEYRRNNSSYMEVMADLIIRTAQQHLRVAWQRLSVPSGKNISVLVADMETWSRGSSFSPGRTDSRLGVAIDWLRQLKLIGDAGITASGGDFLARAIQSLARA